MIENEIYCFIDGFLKWNISKKSSYIVGKKTSSGNFCILNLRNKRKSIFARVIIRNKRLKKITKETVKIIIKSTYRWNNRTKFRKWITKGEFVHFMSTIDASRRRTRRIQFIIFNFVKKSFCFKGGEPEGYSLSYSISLKKFFCDNLLRKRCSKASGFKVESSSSF